MSDGTGALTRATRLQAQLATARDRRDGEIAEAVRRGQPVPRVAVALGLTPATVYEIVRKHGVKLPHHISMSEVARAAGVSAQTASRVFSNDGANVAEDTRKRVLAAAKRLGYKAPT